MYRPVRDTGEKENAGDWLPTYFFKYRDGGNKVFDSFIFALQHLTRFHLFKATFDERRFGRSGMFFPLVGLILGGLLIIVYWFADFFLPPAAVAAIAVVGLVIMTGGMHLDGLMDTIDGIYSGRSRLKKLEIMKDSRVGAFGVLGAVCLLLLKFSLFMGLGGVSYFSALIMMTVFGRWSMTYAIARFPYAREEGMGKLYKIHTGNIELAVASLTAFIVALAAGSIGGIIILVVTALTAHLLCGHWKIALGGLTGDTYGALSEILEVFVLVLYLLLLGKAPFLFFW